MDWTSLIATIVSTGFLISLYEIIRYRKENKKIKESEAELADSNAQERQMDLAEKYLEKVLALTEKSSGDSTKILEAIESMDKRLSYIENYLDGPYKEWVQRVGNIQITSRSIH